MQLWALPLRVTWLLASAEGALPLLFVFVLLAVIYALTWLALSVGGGEERGRLETRQERKFVRGDVASYPVGCVSFEERGAAFRLTGSALHHECLSENGRCPTLGCGGAGATRAGVVAA